jgi:hypothetical protein
MSSLKDIMDMEAYSRSREAAQQQQLQASSRTSIASLSEPHEPPTVDDESIEVNSATKRRRSNRPSHLTSSTASQSRSASTRRGSSAQGEEGMDYQTGFQHGGMTQAGTSDSPQLSSRGSEPATELPVKYTPVTGRISRAKKGVPVHTCDVCRPVKTFTRAEHLR